MLFSNSLNSKNKLETEGDIPIIFVSSFVQTGRLTMYDNRCLLRHDRSINHHDHESLSSYVKVYFLLLHHDQISINMSGKYYQPPLEVHLLQIQSI